MGRLAARIVELAERYGEPSEEGVTVTSPLPGRILQHGREPRAQGSHMRFRGCGSSAGCTPSAECCSSAICKVARAGSVVRYPAAPTRAEERAVADMCTGERRRRCHPRSRADPPRRIDREPRWVQNKRGTSRTAWMAPPRAWRLPKGTAHTVARTPGRSSRWRLSPTNWRPT